jgi:signal transduction histidine kinase
MRLADFIVSNMEPILLEWEAFARGITPGAKMDALALRDHAGAILLATVHDMRSLQSATQQAAKARGHYHDDAPLNGASEMHAVGRLGSGFDLMEVVSEYRALRASVLRLWRDSAPEAHELEMDDLTRFNESIDQSLTKAVSSYTKRVDQSRDLFLAILSHDLRNPLNSIAMSAALLPQLADSNLESAQTASQISTSVSLMARMISDLLDYTRTRLGAGMPVLAAPMDLGTICQAVFDEYRSSFPNRVISFESEGDLTGSWDADRLRQMISNLLGNAVQHGAEDVPIDLKLRGEASDILFVVHNGGPPILSGELPKIFEPLVRGSSAGRPKANRPGSIGLGLYIAREIALSHGGTIDVTSTQEAGTSFAVRLPRHSLVKSGQPILDEKHIQTM